MAATLEPELGTWENVLTDEFVDVALDEVEFDGSESQGLRIVLPASERSEENERQFSEKLEGRINHRLAGYEGMSSWDIYKESFSRGKFIRTVVPLVTGCWTYVFDRAARAAGAYDANYTYVLWGAYLLTFGVLEWMSFCDVSNKVTSKIAALHAALEDSSVAYVDNVKL